MDPNIASEPIIVHSSGSELSYDPSLILPECPLTDGSYDEVYNEGSSQTFYSPLPDRINVADGDNEDSEDSDGMCSHLIRTQSDKVFLTEEEYQRREKQIFKIDPYQIAMGNGVAYTKSSLEMMNSMVNDLNRRLTRFERNIKTSIVVSSVALLGVGIIIFKLLR